MMLDPSFDNSQNWRKARVGTSVAL